MIKVNRKMLAPLALVLALTALPTAAFAAKPPHPPTGKTLSVSLAITPTPVVYGRVENLSGKISDKSVGQNVQILAQSCAQASASAIATATTTTGGSFTFQQRPLNNTHYWVKVKNVTSNAVLAAVRPWQQLKKTSLHHFSLRVSAKTSFAGKYVTFQRYNSTLQRWVNVKTVILRTNSTGIAPTVVSSATFTSNIARPQRVRTVLGQSQAGSCYVAGHSNVIYN